MKTSPIVYWITGLSGSGKTTIGQALWRELEKSGDKVVFLDGDQMRPLIATELGYTDADRRICALRYGGLCKLLHDQGFTVICCTISMFHEVQRWNRENISGYVEIFLKVSRETLETRNQKELYSGNAPDMMGRDLKAEFPKNPDIIIENNVNNCEIKDILERILSK